MERRTLPIIAAAVAVVLCLAAPAWAELNEHHPPPTIPRPAAPAPLKPMTSSVRGVTAPKLAPLHTSTDLQAESLGSALRPGPSPARRALAEKLRTALHAPPSQLPAIQPAAGRSSRRAEEQQYISVQLQEMREADQARLQSLQQQNRNAQFEVQQDYFDKLQQERIAALKPTETGRTSAYYTQPYYRYFFHGRRVTSRAGGGLLQQAVSYGCKTGYAAGAADRADRMPAASTRSLAYQDASYGYNGIIVPRNDYKYYFRKGYQRCYREGYNGRRSLGSVLEGVLGGVLHLEPMR